MPASRSCTARVSSVSSMGSSSARSNRRPMSVSPTMSPCIKSVVRYRWSMPSTSKAAIAVGIFMHDAGMNNLFPSCSYTVCFVVASYRYTPRSVLSKRFERAMRCSTSCAKSESRLSNSGSTGSRCDTRAASPSESSLKQSATSPPNHHSKATALAATAMPKAASSTMRCFLLLLFCFRPAIFADKVTIFLPKPKGFATFFVTSRSKRHYLIFYSHTRTSTKNLHISMQPFTPVNVKLHVDK